VVFKALAPDRASWLGPRQPDAGWQPLGGAAAATMATSDPPAAVATAPDRVDVFVRSAATGLVHQRTLQGAGDAWGGASSASQGGGGGAWTSLGGPQIRGRPAAASTRPGTIDLVARVAADGTYAHRSLAENGAWGPWASLGPGQFLSPPTALSMGPGALAVFGRRADGLVTAKFKIDAAGGWLPGATTWWVVGAGAGSDVTAVASGPGAFELFVRDANTSAVAHKSWRASAATPVGTWLPSAGGWATMSGVVATGQPAAALRPGGSGSESGSAAAIVDVFARASDGALRGRAVDAATLRYSSTWRALGSERLAAGTWPTAAVLGDNGAGGPARLDVFACSASRGPGYGIQAYWSAADGWRP
jgi:hypothetical protein